MSQWSPRMLQLFNSIVQREHMGLISKSSILGPAALERLRATFALQHSTQPKGGSHASA